MVIYKSDCYCVLMRPQSRFINFNGAHDEVPTPVPILLICLLGQHYISGLSRAGVTGLTSENFSDVVYS